MMLNCSFLSRSTALISAVVLSLTVALSASADELENQLRTCAQQSSDGARLACFDALASAVSVDSEPAAAANEAPVTVPVSEDAMSVQVDPSTGAPVKVSESDTAVKNTDTFGTAEEQKQSIRVMLEKTKRNSRGDWYFYFDNGEVWKQIDTRKRRIPSLPVAATVSRGIFSSHKLHIDGEVWSMKIRRVK